MSIENKIANTCWNEYTRATTASYSRHGVSKMARRVKRTLNKAARVKAAKHHFKTFEV